MIPLLHDFTDTTVLVVGGGRVGARKARRFAREARVVVVSPAFADEGEDAPAVDFGGAEKVRAALEPDDVGDWLDRLDPVLVVAATDDGELNAAVERAAKARTVLVNRTDTHGGRDPGSVVVPATVRDDPVVVAISTGGASPALSKHLRETLEEDIEGSGAMAELTGLVREELQAREIQPERRRTVVRDVVRSPDVWTALRTGNPNLRQIAREVVADRALDEA
ncbi:precorrin-2 dehydrogenase/sirohydrochlorin ferrochelatase family protein [Haloarchaeobius salinus]|uniref:precorrin-2 dehydrogenase/sirohydrochlorin ferrochelatase family protein n=1 Tax=Haloarchaeobius salinus TaxID=1198298 RepID=UPI00210E2F5D|nr:bifunctional precorrin-2 dehydrogenase/sirohydrochlorin ferrochelatase [Haloarchaeobius salinus]